MKGDSPRGCGWVGGGGGSSLVRAESSSPVRRATEEMSGRDSTI